MANIIKVLNTWRMLENWGRNEEYDFPLWFYADGDGGGYSFIDTKITLELPLRMFIHRYEQGVFPFYYYLSKEGSEYFSWIYDELRDMKSIETYRTWLSREENRRLGVDK